VQSLHQLNTEFVCPKVLERKLKRKTRTKEDELREELAQLMSSVTEPEEDEIPQTLKQRL